MRKLLYGSLLFIASFCFGIKIQASRINDLGAPDSIIYQLNDLNKTYKTVYQYSVNGFISTTSLFDDSSFIWIPAKQNNLQDIAGVETLVESNFNSATNSFVNYQKFETKTDSLGRCILHAFYAWNPISSNWKGVNVKTEKSFDSNGNLLSFANSRWDSINQVWVIYATGNFSYNSAGKQDSVKYFAPDTLKQLIPTSRIINSYLTNGKPETETILSYSSSDATFVPVFRYRYLYSDTIDRTTQFVESFDVTNNQWNSFQKTETTFDKSANLSSHVVSDMDSLGQSWVERYRQNLAVTAGQANSVQATISYSANNKELASEKFQFNNEGGSTTLSDTLYQEGLLNAYDQSKFVSKNDEITAFSNKNQNDNSRLDWDIDETNKILNVTQFTRPSTSTTKSEEINRSILFYFGTATHPTTTSVPQVPVGKLTFYPNPVRETVTIVNSTAQNCNFRILSIDGKPIKSGVANESINAVSVVSLPQGAYILQLSSGNTLTSGILIKQ